MKRGRPVGSGHREAFASAMSNKRGIAPCGALGARGKEERLQLIKKVVRIQRFVLYRSVSPCSVSRKCERICAVSSDPEVSREIL